MKLAIWYHVIGLEKEENLQKTDILYEGKGGDAALEEYGGPTGNYET